MELAGPITLSPNDHAELLFGLLMVLVAGAALVGAVVAGIVGSRRRPPAGLRLAAQTAAMILVLGGGCSALVAHSTTIRSSTGAPVPSVAARVPISVVTPPELAVCDDAALQAQIQTNVARRADVTLKRCTGLYAVLDVDTTAGVPDPVSYRTYWRRGPTNEWSLLVMDRNPRCGQIQQIDPMFPPILCRDLPGPLLEGDRSITGTPTST